MFEVAIEASSQALFADASDVATHMANHVLHQPIGHAVVHHAFAQLADVVFDTVADVAFKNGATKLSNLQIGEITRKSCAGIIFAWLSNQDAFEVVLNALSDTPADLAIQHVNQRLILMLIHILVHILVDILNRMLNHTLDHTLDEASSERSIAFVFGVSS